MTVRSADFESAASACSATRARGENEPVDYTEMSGPRQEGRRQGETSFLP